MSSRSHSKGTASVSSTSYNFRNAKLPFLSSFFGSSDSLNPSRMNRELNRLEPRFQELEHEISTLRQHVPIGLNSIIEQIKSDCISLDNKICTNELSANSQNNSDQLTDSEGNNTNDIDQQLEELKANIEKRVVIQIESKLKQFSTLSTTEANSDKTPDGKTVDNLADQTGKFVIDDEEDLLEEISQRIEALSDLTAAKRMRTQQRIMSIESNIKRFNSASDLRGGENNSVNSGARDLRQINEDCELHRGEIAKIKDTISELQQNISKQFTPKIQYTRPSNDNTNDGANNVDSVISKPISLVPDLSNQLDELKSDVVVVKEEFSKSLAELKKETDECEKESAEVSSIVQDLSIKTDEMEAKAIESNRLIIQLLEKVNSISKKADEKDFEKEIKKIIEKIQEGNDAIKNEIENIKKRASGKTPAAVKYQIESSRSKKDSSEKVEEEKKDENKEKEKANDANENEAEDNKKRTSQSQEGERKPVETESKKNRIALSQPHSPKNGKGKKKEALT